MHDGRLELTEPVIQTQGFVSIGSRQDPYTLDNSLLIPYTIPDGTAMTAL